MEIIKPQIIGINQTSEKLQVAWGQRVGSILNQNEISRRNSAENWKRDEDIKHYARIPRIVWMLWQSLGITEDEKELDKAIERNAALKVTEKCLA